MPSQQLIDLVELLPAETIPEELYPLEEIPLHRRNQEEMMTQAYPVPTEVIRETIDAGGTHATWFRTERAAKDRAILYIHGGGFMWGSPVTHAELISRIALATGIPCLAVDYRKSPEHVYPAALNDCTDTYLWLTEQGYTPNNIALVGDSAGGGLVLSTLTRLKNDGWPLPAAAVTSSAFTDLTLGGTSMKNADDPLCTEKGLKLLGDTYADGAELTNPELSPLFADYTGHPPLLLQVGERELLLSDTERVAAKAEYEGVDATLEVYEGACHLWHWFGPDVPESIQAIESIKQFIGKHLA